MSSKHSTTNTQLPDRLYGEHYPDSFLDVSRPVLTTRYRPVDDNDKHVREECNESNKPNIASQPVESNFEHICPNNPILTCNCADPNACAELGNDPDSQHGNKRCPESGRICHESVCPNKCLGDKDGFSDNLDYTGIPIPTSKGKDSISGWPCVVVGAICEAWTTATKHVLRTTASEWNTKQHTDAGLNNDGSATTKGL
jgi:hypothetical protein